MSVAPLSDVRALDLGPEPVRPGTALTDDTGAPRPGAAAVAGSLVVFAPGVIAQHQRDVHESVLLAQLAANAKAERHKDPVEWFRAYRAVLEQICWVVEAGSTVTRYLPQVSRFSAGTVVVDTFRPKVVPAELAYISAALAALRSDAGGAARFVFECPSHSGGIGNFQVVLAAEDDGLVGIRLAQVSFNAPQHVTRLLLEEFTGTAQFQAGFLALTQNADLYDQVRSTISAKVQSRYAGSVTPLPLD